MNPFKNHKRLVMAGAVAGCLFTGAALGATVLGPTLVNAATSTPTPSGTGSSSTGTGSSMPAHGTQAHESAEAAVTGANASKAQAAAVKAVGSGTAGAVTSDFNQTGYEVTVTKSDGSTVEVHLDSSFNVMQGPGHGGGPDNDADDAGSSSGTSSSSSNG